MRLAAVALALPLLALLARPARAGGPTDGEATVYMKDGGLIRGKLIEVRPNDHATVLLATGQTATITWALIDRIDAGAPPATPSAASSPPSRSSPPSQDRKTATVHIESDRPLRLEVEEGRRDWAFVCQSPCDKEVEVGPKYRILGSGVRATRPFQIEAQPGQHVVIEVDTSSKAAFVVGIVLVSVSPVVSLAGLVVIVLGGGGTAGPALVIGGLVGIAVGTVMIATTARSGYTQSTAAPAAPMRDAAREPIWAASAVAPPPPPTVEVPIFRF